MIDPRSRHWLQSRRFRRCHARCAALFTTSSSTVFCFFWFRLCAWSPPRGLCKEFGLICLDWWRVPPLFTRSLSLLLPLYLALLLQTKNQCLLMFCINADWTHFYGLGKYWQSSKRKLLRRWASADKTLSVSHRFFKSTVINTKLFLVFFGILS